MDINESLKQIELLIETFEKKDFFVLEHKFEDTDSSMSNKLIKKIFTDKYGLEYNQKSQNIILVDHNSIERSNYEINNFKNMIILDHHASDCANDKDNKNIISIIDDSYSSTTEIIYVLFKQYIISSKDKRFFLEPILSGILHDTQSFMNSMTANHLEIMGLCLSENIDVSNMMRVGNYLTPEDVDFFEKVIRRNSIETEEKNVIYLRFKNYNFNLSKLDFFIKSFYNYDFIIYEFNKRISFRTNIDIDLFDFSEKYSADSAGHKKCISIQKDEVSPKKAGRNILKFINELNISTKI